MTATTMPASTIPTTIPAANPAAPVRLRRPAIRSGLLAAAATTGIAAIALAAGVPLALEGEQIPLIGFAQLTLVCTALGVALAAGLRRWAARPRRTFTVVTIVLAALSIVPDLVFPASAATRLVLILTHLVAAAIVIPALARALPARRP